MLVVVMSFTKLVDMSIDQNSENIDLRKSTIRREKQDSFFKKVNPLIMFPAFMGLQSAISIGKTKKKLAFKNLNKYDSYCLKQQSYGSKFGRNKR